MAIQGNWTQHEWDTLNVFQLTSLHMLRTCNQVEYESADSIRELVFRIWGIKN